MVLLSHLPHLYICPHLSPLWETIYFPMLNAQYPSLVDQSNEKVKKLVQISMFLKIKIV